MNAFSKTLFVFVWPLWLLSFNAILAQVYINEVMSVNKSTIADEDNDYVDWLELYNASPQTVNLAGWGLSDKKDDPFKWVAPPVDLAPQQYLLIFASGKDRRQQVCWDNVITSGDIWKYRRGDSQPPRNWKDKDFDDSGWNSGPSGFGYGDDDDATVIGNLLSVYVRKSFQIQDVEKIVRLALHVDYDDAFIAYLNGVEVARANIGVPGESVRYNSTADGNHEALMIQGLPPQFFDISKAADVLQSGRNVLAIEVHNVSSGSSDMTLIPFFTIGWSAQKNGLHTPPDFLGLRSAQMHTNFKIKGSGESIALYDSTGLLQDSLFTPEMPMDISYGRLPGSGDWRLLALPTPGTTNRDSVYVGRASAPQASPGGGFYNAPIIVELSDSSGGIIYYTLDGSTPDENSDVYTGPIVLHETTVLRARSFRPPLQPSRIITHTFVFNEDSPFAVICLTSDPSNLYDYNYGIFVKGPNAGGQYPYFGANFWQDWERPVHVEFYEPNGQPGFEIDAGMKIFGGWSRARDQKSLAIFRRSIYDTRRINYRIFPDKEIEHFESFILRNGGNDWDGTLFRDGFMQTLCRDEMDLELMAFRPAHIYLNGEYWGILNIREKINEHFLQANRGIDPDRVDLLDRSGQGEDEIMTGTNSDYLMLLDFLNSHDISRPEYYAVVDSMMDISNFIDYEIAEIYLGNTDWPGNNIKYYKPQTPGGKWRWLLFDTDFGFHLYETSYSHNTLAFATATNGPDWPNPPWSTFLLRTLLQNDYFRLLFINRFADHLNTTFQPERVHHILDQFQEMFDSQISRQRKRWPGSVGAYHDRLQRMRTFADRRLTYVRSHIRKYFKLQGLLNVTLDVDPAGAGRIQINSKTIAEFPWAGVYFEDIPVTLTAIPNVGCRFVGWSDARLGASRVARLKTRTDAKIIARFEPYEGDNHDVLINEINYNSGRDFPAKDWIELVNTSDATISLAGWQASDGDAGHVFTFPVDAFIPAKGYAVISRDTTHFNAVYSNVDNVYGNLEFDLSNAGEFVVLSDDAGAVIDSLTFDDAPPWPVDADGEGFTLELKHPHFNNNDPANWSASAVIGGTPGRSNSVVARVETKRAVSPQAFRLAQNYPNPFNPTTTIRYNLPAKAHVRLIVFDVLGRQVQTLVDKRQPAGQYSISWTANLPSGLYFYRLEAETERRLFSETKKMLLVR